ncbi:alpha-1,4-glucan--maltose-1-phosphate maltosyltransferase [Autumnicola psychrophila]|uniref:Alpha-1,4-glucan:maltose-1-phosphate maltosyltransferase n=1 Tax=Autumnicola psychrophila TaxID=3075592 RepID=A0ABU3DQ97_9FLAO|nr:alpha-1,4-glucan--maltose-1-phosphate maltosyltransferase [Zunongwangia sp. F225]MDT0685875.1 alpha-1,4-glucan--maltose-1-phosphate maltosyltransferase [Zunongwangia sp. F225]
MKLEGQKRVSIQNVSPQIEGGKYPIKRIINEKIEVEADIFGDGHDKVDAVLLYRESRRGSGKDKKWEELPMIFEGNDHWSAAFEGAKLGTYEYTIEGWIDHFSTWKYGLKKKIEDKQNVRTELLIGADLMEDALERLPATQKKQLRNWIKLIKDEEKESEAISKVFEDAVKKIMYQARNREKATQYHKILTARVERKRALFSAWYEFFPRSTAENHGEHGTFKSSERILPEIANMGFDVIYLPPIHPIGKSHRKGTNNATEAKPGEPGSPWAIGSEEGGHKAIHPELGTLEDFTSFIKKAESHGIEVAIDFAIQCSPDHPYVKEHPQWFKWRPDGTVQYAENPPKKYQDVLPVNFETEDWENLWKELKSVVEYWIDKGVKIFRVDNPHTKSFIFWEWLIKEIDKKHQDIIFLAEAFTRPRVMEELAKVGFTQSYTYFTWRNSKEEFEEYLTELTKTELREYFRPNFWPNTPDILPVSLEDKGEASFLIRIILASTLSSNYGIYGPLFEFGENEAYPGKEEYTRSEKYEVKHWDWYRPTRIKELIGKLNSIRNENPALQTTYNIAFAETDNDQIICYTKIDRQTGNKLITVVNINPDHTQSGWIKVPLNELEIQGHEPFAVHDLLTGSRYIWQNEWNYVELHPQAMPAHILRVETVTER